MCSSKHIRLPEFVNSKPILLGPLLLQLMAFAETDIEREGDGAGGKARIPGSQCLPSHRPEPEAMSREEEGEVLAGKCVH